MDYQTIENPGIAILPIGTHWGAHPVWKVLGKRSIKNTLQVQIAYMEQLRLINHFTGCASQEFQYRLALTNEQQL